MIEKDIKIIRKNQRVTHTKTAQELKSLSRRQTSHEKANSKQFQVITSAITELPTQDVITKTIQDTIKVVVNGKIDHLTELVNTTTGKVDMVGEHLKAQDEVAEEHGKAIQDLSEQIAPYNEAKTWAITAVKVVQYLGGIAAAVAAIVGLYYLFHQ